MICTFFPSLCQPADYATKRIIIRKICKADCECTNCHTTIYSIPPVTRNTPYSSALMGPHHLTRSFGNESNTFSINHKKKKRQKPSIAIYGTICKGIYHVTSFSLREELHKNHPY